MHGSSAPAAREAAAQRELAARAEVVLDRLDVEPVADPLGALMKVTSEVLALRDWLSQQFNQADNDSAFLLAEALGRGLDRASRLLIELHRLGLDQRRVRVEEDQARLLVAAMHATVSALGHDPWSAEVRAAVRHGFETIDGDVEAST